MGHELAVGGKAADCQPMWVRVWVRQLTRILTHTIFSIFATKKHRKPKFSMLFGAGGVTRTHDLLITKCIGVLRLAVFRAFGAFPLGILREVRPILSIVFVRSFPRVGHGVGQKRSLNPATSFTERRKRWISL